MTDKVVVITGGGRGMGFEATKKFLSLGARVFLGVRKPDTVESKFKSELDPSQMERVTCIQLDLLSTKSVREFTEKLLNQTSSVHVLLNNGKLYLLAKKKMIIFTYNNYQVPVFG